MKKMQNTTMEQAKAEAVRILTEAVERAVGVLAGSGAPEPCRMYADRHMTKEEVRDYLKLPSVRTVEKYMRAKKLPNYKPSRQATRFLKSEVDQAMKHFHIKAANADR